MDPEIAEGKPVVDAVVVEGKPEGKSVGSARRALTMSRRSAAREAKLNERRVARYDVAKTMAIALLLEGKNQREVCRELSLSSSTLTTWVRHDEPFRAELERKQREILQTAHRKLAALASNAVDVMARLLKSTDEKIQLGAARAILGMCGVASSSGSNKPSVMVDARTLVQGAENVMTNGAIVPQDFAL